MQRQTLTYSALAVIAGLIRLACKRNSFDIDEYETVAKSYGLLTETLEKMKDSSQEEVQLEFDFEPTNIIEFPTKPAA